MKLFRILLAGVICVTAVPAVQAHGPRLSFGINFGIPVYSPRPWCPGPPVFYHPGYYVPPPVVVAPAPVMIQQPQVVVPPAPVYQQPAPVYQQPAPSQVLHQPTTVTSTFQTADLKKSAEVEHLLQLLNDPDERVRAEVVIQLGRLKADRAVDPLTATLAGDKSPLARDNAARALGLIGAHRALTALMHSAQADPDHDVRRSAQFAVEIIKLNHGLK